MGRSKVPRITHFCHWNHNDSQKILFLHTIVVIIDNNSDEIKKKKKPTYKVDCIHMIL